MGWIRKCPIVLPNYPIHLLVRVWRIFCKVNFSLDQILVLRFFEQYLFLGL